MIKPALVVMAAGIGSRYGGLKQIDPIGPNGEIIVDYSIYDAVKAGFGKIIFIINKDIQEIFREKIGKQVEKVIDTEYIIQRLEDIPKYFNVPLDRKKPWGTAHAVMSCRNVINTPFAVINADDFYGSTSFKLLCDYLKNVSDKNEIYHYCMVGFVLENTLSENGHVARGICSFDSNSYLKEIHERTRIEKFGSVTKYTEDGVKWVDIPKGTTVSMNTWGLTPNVFNELEVRFTNFFELNKDNLMKAEYFLPEVIGSLIEERKAEVKVLPSKERWYGVTYKEDKPLVKQAISSMIERVYIRKIYGGIVTIP